MGWLWMTRSMGDESGHGFPSETRTSYSQSAEGG